MCVVHHLESVRLSVLMKLAACVIKTALPIMTQCALRMGQHTTTNAGMSCTTVEGWRIILCITQEAVRVRKNFWFLKDMSALIWYRLLVPAHVAMVSVV